ncbi:hypothetical protein WJ968_14695 [Achromobacter xylosoxidans]
MSNDEQFPRTAFSRRRFMQAMGVASGTLMAGGLMGARVNAAEDRSDSFDYVIVGAGSVGCVLANRLTEDPGVKVLLIEAGGPDNSEKISTPLRLIELWKSPMTGPTTPCRRCMLMTASCSGRAARPWAAAVRSTA